MDEYEVDLRDYLSVIWRRKWIILGVFVVAVASAVIYSYTLPDEYRAWALLDYQSAPIDGAALGNSPMSDAPAGNPLRLPQANALVAIVESAGNVQAETLNGSNLLRVQIAEAASPDQLERRLQGAIDAVRRFLRDQMEERVTERLGILADEIRFLEDQRTSLLNRLAERDAQRLQVLQSQRDRIVQQLDQLMNSSAGESSGSASGQAALLALMSQLQVLQSEMARLDAGSPAGAAQPEAGSAYEQRLVDLETRLQNLELAQRQYERLRNRDWSPLSVAQPPQGSDMPVGPNRRLNIAIAGILGLFVGLLLAFFVHYLQSEPLWPDRARNAD